MKKLTCRSDEDVFRVFVCALHRHTCKIANNDETRTMFSSISFRYKSSQPSSHIIYFRIN